MNLWVAKFKKLCEVNQLDPLLLKIYVDDKNSLWKQMRKGIKWNGVRMEWHEEWYREDCESGVEGDKRKMLEIQKLANSIEKDI